MAPTPLLADAWLHDLNPILVHISGALAIRWYGLSYILGFVLAWLLLARLSKRGVIRMTPQQVGDAIMLLVLGVMVGGRLGYCLFYQPGLFAEFSSSPPWWGVLAINKGGMASHGGMLGVIVAGIVIARRMKLPTLHLFDCFALAAPIGLGLGRIANFINGELLGSIVAKPGATAPWWSVRYPQEIVERTDEYLDQLSSEQAGELSTLAANQLVADGIATPGGPLPEDWFERGCAAIVRAVHDGNEGVKAAIEPLLTARHPSQLYQAFAEGLLLFLVLLIIWRKPRTPGVIGAWFLIVYGIGRIVTELFRLPDPQFANPRLFASSAFQGLSRGQLLSTLMILAGVVMLVVVSRRGGEKLGGWASPPKPTEPATA